MKSQFNLLTKRRFLPLFITQFLGAFNDNVYKNALVVLFSYVIGHKIGLDPKILVTVTGTLLIVPMILFSATAGLLADKFEKSRAIRLFKGAEIILMLLGGIGFYYENITLLLTVLFFMGMQSTFFGPIKYSILPTHLEKSELIAGNGLIEMGTFLSILIGNILGAIVVSMPGGILYAAATVISIAVIGFIACLFIPKAPSPSPNLPVTWNFIKTTWEVISYVRTKKDIYLCILAISWFWLLGFVFLSQFPNLAKFVVGGNEQVFILFLTIFSLGVGIGSCMCNRLLNGNIEATFVPLSAIAMSVFTIDMCLACNLAYANLPANFTNNLQTPIQFLSSWNNIRIAIDMLLVSICGGIYIVPLYAILQDRGEKKHKARIIGANNILNAFFMAFGALGTIALFKWDFTLPQVFLTVAIINLLVAIRICSLLPGALLRAMLRLVLTFLYRAKITGLDQFNQAGPRVVITPNHMSFLDGLLLAAFMPSDVTFAISNEYFTRWWIKPILLIVKAYGVDPTNPMSMKSLIKLVQANNRIVIFPEGRITVTGSLMKIYEGPGMIADKANATIVPIRIKGAEHTPFSRAKEQIKTKWFPNISLTVLKPEKMDIDKSIMGKERRKAIGDKLYLIMSQMLFASGNTEQTLYQALLDANDIHGGNTTIVDDVRRNTLNYRRLIMASHILGRKLAQMTNEGETVGLLLPNSSGYCVSFFALQAFRRVTAMLNFSTGSKSLLASCETAKIKLVCTSREFIKVMNLQEMVDTLVNSGISVLYLEDLKASVGISDKIYGLFSYAFPRLVGEAQSEEKVIKLSEKPAVILFTSGSEGSPKAVVLSHKNLQSNRLQLSSRVDFSPKDIVLNALPMFHSFGLTAGTLLPILSGMKVFLYPSPLHYRIIPELSYDLNATIFFGTNTFLEGYAQYASAYDFYSIRYVFAGAEKLKSETRKTWADKFGIRIFEGYGATETSPVISTNTPMHNKSDTVGRLVPGMECQIKPVPGIEEGGRLFVKGPNVMLGYYFHDKPGQLVPPPDGWYDTGDIIDMDSEGYLSIKGRAKRFAKIAGEMVSLTAVESMVAELWPDDQHAVVSVPDQKKGEQLILVTTRNKTDRGEISRFASKQGITELAVPKTILSVEEIPVLNTGKTNYVSLQTMVGGLVG